MNNSLVFHQLRDMLLQFKVCLYSYFYSITLSKIFVPPVAVSTRAFQRIKRLRRLQNIPGFDALKTDGKRWIIHKSEWTVSTKNPSVRHKVTHSTFWRPKLLTPPPPQKKTLPFKNLWRVFFLYIVGSKKEGKTYFLPTHRCDNATLIDYLTHRSSLGWSDEDARNFESATETSQTSPKKDNGAERVPDSPVRSKNKVGRQKRMKGHWRWGGEAGHEKNIERNKIQVFRNTSRASDIDSVDCEAGRPWPWNLNFFCPGFDRVYAGYKKEGSPITGWPVLSDGVVKTNGIIQRFFHTIHTWSKNCRHNSTTAW